MYKEIAEDELEKLFQQHYKKLFIIYRMIENNIVLFARFDGMAAHLKDPALIVFDYIKIRVAERFIEGTVNYCIDEVESREYRTVDELKTYLGNFTNFIPIAHGEWKYFNHNDSILYYGHHIKKQSLEGKTIEQKPFQMIHQLTFRKNYWSREDFFNFSRNKYVIC